MRTKSDIKKEKQIYYFVIPKKYKFLLKLKKNIKYDILDNISINNYDMDFLNKPLGLMKKNYLYIKKIIDKEGKDTGQRKIVFKNLGVKKKSTSQLTRYIFREILMPKILEEKKVKFSKTFFKNTIQELLESNPDLITKRFKVFKPGAYKHPGQLQAQIATKYGPGIHFLVCNNRMGVGKGVKYCSLKEFKDNKMRLEDLDLSGVWSELGYFIAEEKKLTLDNW